MSLFLEEIEAVLPSAVTREIVGVCSQRRGGTELIGEIRIAAGKSSSVLLRGERVFLSVYLTVGDIGDTLIKLCRGALYAHRDTLSEGYVSIGGGVRVGVCGRARYDGDSLVGVSDVTSLVFRIPSGACEFLDRLLVAWRECKRGMLIYAPPGGGKTTALRALASSISEGRHGVRVVVVDERCEFLSEECSRCGVDLMRGYKRADGMEIALRVLAPQVIVVDEIGSEREARLMADLLNSGVKIIATAHADSLETLTDRGAITPFLERKIFDVFVGIFYTDGKYLLKSERI